MKKLRAMIDETRATAVATRNAQRQRHTTSFAERQAMKAVLAGLDAASRALEACIEASRMQEPSDS